MATSLPLVTALAYFIAAPPCPAEQKPAAARADKVHGVLLAKEGATFRAIKSADGVPTEKLLVALPAAEIQAGSNAVRLTLLADVGKRGPLPVLETAVVLHESKDVDLDVTLARGLIVFTNLRKTGQAKVKVRVGSEAWTFTLHDPGTKIALETYGRLQPGIPIDLKKIGNPVTEVAGLVLAGEAFVELGNRGVGLKAPPGPAALHWDSLGSTFGVTRLEKLPDTVAQALNDRQNKVFTEICAACTDRAHDQALGAWLKELVEADSATQRLLGVTLAGAVDELGVVREALATSKNPQVREHAVLVLRHWLGREPGQVDKLYTALTREKGLTDVQARSILQLLIGFDHDERARPATYELLIQYLRHSKQGVRELAHWHLVRLVPAGRTIRYDAAAPEAERQQAYEMWQQLIPSGQLPPEGKTEK